MSAIGPERAEELARLLGELAELRRREARLLERVQEIVRSAAALSREAIAQGRAPAEAAASPDPSAAPPGGELDWLDRAVDAALGRAFGTAVEPDEDAGDSGEEEIPAVAHASTPSAASLDLVLLQSGDLTAGFPWGEVLSFDLAEEGEDAAAQSSLYTLVEGEGGRRPASEPYRLRWRTGGAVQAIRCERMAGVVAATEAAARGVEIVIAPASGAGEPPCRLLTLLDYLAGAGPEQAAPPDAAKTPDRPASPASPASREAAPPETEVSVRSPASGPTPLLDLGRLRAASPRGSALVAVRYLPARVAIARVLRSLGWNVVQAADNQELPGLLHLGSYAVVFAEPPDPLEPGWVEAARRAHAAGGSVVVVASRLRAAGRDPLRELEDAPRLLHPFREGEIERVLGALASPSR